MIHPWCAVPLADYERHMAHDTVGQAALLAALTGKYLSLLKPASCLFLGVAGGNGLEHVDPATTRRVIGVDINPAYLDVCRGRFAQAIPGLELHAADVTGNAPLVGPVECVWAGLVLEYTGIAKGLAYARSNMAPNGQLIVTIQANNHVPTVSATGVESVKQLGAIFTLVEPGELLVQARAQGFTLVSMEENPLPNGKAFITMHLELR